MNDAQNVDATEQTSAPSMSELAATLKETGGNEAAQGQEAQGQQAQQPQTNADNVSEFANFVKNQEELANQLQDTRSQLDELVNGSRRDAVKKEIENAVKQINDNAGGDETLAELWLEKQYRENGDFRKIWENRAENPDAYSAALKMLAPEWESTVQTTIDPQVAENQRALKESQRAGGAVQQSSLDDKLSDMNDGEFMRYMKRLQS